MALKARTADELIRIVAVGGGVRFDGRARRTADLIMISAATKKNGGQAIFTGMSARTTDELIQIAAAGAGHVIFED